MPSVIYHTIMPFITPPNHPNIPTSIPNITLQPDIDIDNHIDKFLQDHQEFEYDHTDYLPTHYDFDDNQNDEQPNNTQKQTSFEDLPHPGATPEQNNTQYHPTTTQQVITPPIDNLPFGDLLQSTKPTDSIRFLFQNINGIRSYNEWSPWTHACHSLQELQVDIFGIAETNIKWNKKHQTTARRLCQRHYNSALIATSSSNDITKTDYQPGGTATIITNKWTGRSTSNIHDTSGLGRWSGFKMRRNNNKHLNVITVYQPTISNGSQTCYQQHMNILRQKGIKNPNPRKQLISDLTNVITHWNNNGDFTIVMMDANEGLHDRNSTLPMFLTRTNMTPLLHQAHEYPSTYVRGTQCIDYIFGSTVLQPFILQSGFTPFFENPWPSTDHRALFVDINNIGLFGATTHSLLPSVPRKLTSTSHTLVKKFLTLLQETHALPPLLNRITTLANNSTWQQLDHDALESIDQEFTSILLKAESQCAVPTAYPWSLELHNASLVYRYWLIHQKGLKNKRNTTIQLRNIQSQIDEDQIFQMDPTRTSMAQFRLSRKNLIDLQQQSYSKRKDSLHIQHETLVASGKLKQSEAVRIRIARERQRQCWATLRSLTQGTKTSGGISYILIPITSHTINPITGKTTITISSYDRIQTKSELDIALLNRNIHHFAQAAGTPFTTSPLSDLFGFDGCNEAAEQILRGTIPSNITKHTKMILLHLHRIREPMKLSMSFTDMCAGFSKWREQTTTSPSNKHLGIYKSFTNSMKYKILTDYETTNQIKYNDHLQYQTPIAETALHIQYTLMQLAVRECHTYHRWTIVHNFFIEKLPGTPLIDKLRVIHIYEADWSLIQRYYVAHQLSKTAAIEGTLTNEQAGGRPGRSSIEIACNRTFTYETIRLQRLTGAVMYNDAKACYDRIIENLSNITLLREGLPIEIARLHAQTFKQIKYHLKHRLGIGDTTHSHHQPSPIYGVGQGSTDASTRWSFLSDALIRAFNDGATDATITSPLSTLSINNKIAGFVDDTATVLLKHPDLALFLFIFLQQDAQLWERLLHVSGGKLEILKCKFAFFKWYFNHLGIATLSPNNKQQIQVTSSEDQKPLVVQQIDPSTSYKYVGVDIALDGNMNQQIKSLQLKCNKLNSALSQIYLSPQDTAQGYATVFTPSIKYVLPATSISSDVLKKMQIPITNTVLTKFGYNRHMPRAVVFAPITLGGLGLLDLYTEQGCSQILLLLSHLRAQSYLSTTMIIMLESYQVAAGMITPIFEDNANNNIHQPSSWIQSVRQFLYSINGKIIIPELKTINPLRQQDIAIMNNPSIQYFTPTQLEAINACRIYLQVTTIAEISNDTGTHIIPAALSGLYDESNNPIIWQSSQSLLKWPYQLRPPIAAWKLWKRYLKQFTTNTATFQLRSKLGPWNPTCGSQRRWIYKFHENCISQQVTPGQFKIFIQIPSRSRHSIIYSYSHYQTSNINTISIPIIPIETDKHQIRIKIQSIQQINYIQPPITLSTNNIKCNRFHHYLTNTSNNETIYVASDGGLLYDIASFGGVINTNDSTLWEIQGSITPQEHLSSLTAEAYGCFYTMDKLLQEIGILALKHNNIVIICDNQSLLSRLNSLLHYQLTPNMCLTPEYEVISSIVMILKQLPSVSLKHVHSHQKGPLSHEALLNQRCDELATEARTFTPPESTIPILPGSKAIFTINNSHVSSTYINQIRTAALSQDLRIYYQSTNKWNDETIDSINWRCQGRALISLRGRQQKTMLKFIHKWLPINTAHSIQAVGTGRLCPYCKSCDETHLHFLTCRHLQSSTLWIGAAQQVQQAHKQHPIDPVLKKLLYLAITEWRTTASPPIPDFIPVAYHQLFKSQSAIGWNHIINGRFSNEWTAVHDNNPATTTSGDTWLIVTIKSIWHANYHIWKHRCDTNHGTDAESKRTQALLKLRPQVEQLYAQQQFLELQDQRIFSKPIAELLESPTSTIENWVYKAKPLIKRGIHRANINTKKQHLPIHPYFYKVIDSTIHRRPTSPHKPDTNNETRVTRKKQTLAQTITSFFHRRPSKAPNIAPHIPIPHNDDRPP